ncbi:DUF262 domain-containing protein [Fusibacter paucivorans]|uniref:DUF262 domain-containing protein n=1 Tax=Fusibacter paucivorans TaxID=76009 RepID=A0ABS5PVR1_9FIRM|nr:DUF262 domain-containing protein [Fusibacter paucivorans]MBS7528826.1 DUF262 domain-containing protein [Fusibacter paucivorans]
MTEKLQYIINPKEQNLSIQVLVERIRNGFELQEIQEELTDDEILKYNDSIIIEPDYQRDYRSTIKDESSLIESILVGIPIPPIFLANSLLNGVQVMNVIDGQHRLRAFYRFYNNKFALEGLTILKNYDDKNYKSFDMDEKRKFISKEISMILFKDFPGDEFEIEIFSRYNKGTKPLTPQEIRHAVYNSEINQYVNRFSNKLYKEPSMYLSKAYNVTRDRIQKKKLQESIFVVLSILETGIKSEISKSPQYAEHFMKEKAELQKENFEEFQTNYRKLTLMFDSFNKFLISLSDYYEYPFSKEIYGISNRNYKFQISIAMILAAFYHKLSITIKSIDKINESIDLNLFVLYIDDFLNNSFLEDPTYSASSTNPTALISLINEADINFFLKK